MNDMQPITRNRVNDPIEWTDERIEIIKKLWTEGKTASQIAGELGNICTRSAIIGKVHRLKLDGRRRSNAQILADAKTRTSMRHKTETKRSKVHDGKGGKNGGILARIAAGPVVPVKSMLLHSEVWSALPGSTPVALVDLPANGCKWAIGDAPMLFCAAERHNGSPYCETHHGRAYAGFGAGPDGKASPRHAR